MNITINNISFGQLVSTPLLLRAGGGKISFQEAKALNLELGTKYSGVKSFYKRALEIAKKAAEKDKNLADVFAELKSTPPKQFEGKINFYTKKLGEKFDINI